MLALFWYCASDFPTQNRWKTKRDAGLFLHIFGVKINRFFFDFGVIFLPLGGVLGGLGSWRLPSSDFDRFWIDFGTPLGAKLAPTSRPWSVLGRLDTSWGGLCVVWNPSFSDLMTNSFSHLILHRFRIAKRPQNHWKIDEESMPTWSRKRKLISMPLAANFQDNLMLKPKRPIFKNYWKTQCCCAFFEYQLMSIKHKDDVTTMSKKHEKIIAGIIDFWTKKQEF